MLLSCWLERVNQQPTVMNINFCFLTSYICVWLFTLCTFWSYSSYEWAAVHVAFICNYSIVINNLFELWVLVGWCVIRQVEDYPLSPPKLLTFLNSLYPNLFKTAVIKAKSWNSTQICEHKTSGFSL